MKVQYGSLTTNKKNLTMEQTDKKPSVVDIPMEGCYTLVVVDPDAGKKNPSDPRPGNSDRYYLHWLIVNITNGDVNTGRQIVSYQKPTPPVGSGRHEYMFKLYKQPCGLTNGLTSPDVLSNWSLEGFIKGKNLVLEDEKSIFVEQKG